MKSSSCWYSEVCEHYSDNCEYGCVRYVEMKYLMDSSNIPKSKQKPIILRPASVDRDAFIRLSDIKEDIVDFVNQGRHLYLCSSHTGNGKTSWAIKLMLRYFNDIWAGNGYKPRGLFIHVPTFLLKCKDFGNKDAQFEEFKKLITEVDMVIWDDIAGINISSYDYSQLLMYLDARCLNDKTNIYTGNIVSQDTLAKAIGDKLTSRVWSNQTEIIELRGGDRR